MDIGAFWASTFNTCPHQPLKMIEGKPLNITLIPRITPTAVYTLIPVPHHWKKRVKQDIDWDVTLGIIELVCVGTPTTWCSRIVVAPKKDRLPRCMVDQQKFTAATIREMHYTPSSFNQLSMATAHTKKTLLHA